MADGVRVLPHRNYRIYYGVVFLRHRRGPEAAMAQLHRILLPWQEGLMPDG